MSQAHELSKLDPYSFENLVNTIALRVLGSGATGFGPGPDAGRDGYFEGEAPYPSETTRWSGVWYIQSKFHAPHLSKDAQKWLIAQVKEEIKAFNRVNSGRNWPSNWILATNIEPSAARGTGSFDTIRRLVSEAAPNKINVDIWGAQKLLNFLGKFPEIAAHYAHLLSPGHVIASLCERIQDDRASIETLIRYLVATQFGDQVYTKLDQAGSSSDTRPGVHHLFIDLPFTVEQSNTHGLALHHLCRAAAQPLKPSALAEHPKAWRDWLQNPQKARVAVLKGGPGQGKSTVGQYFSQIQRAALLSLPNAPKVTEKLTAVVREVEAAAKSIGAWPAVARIPIFVELKEYAQWYGQRKGDEAKGVLTYITRRVSVKVEQELLPGTLRRALGTESWFILFDGLDEVPNDVKDLIAEEVVRFLNDFVVQDDCDVLALCTSRPQGYSGQFSALDGPVLGLDKLDIDIAIRCAEPVVKYERNEDEATRSIDLLKSAAASSSVRELMTTPLQAHIMAVVVRDGGRPPERRWQLFENFYQVMKKRESLKNVHNARISRLLREEDRLLRAVHTRLGFVLHARAETAEGASASLSRNEFATLVAQVVGKLSDQDIQGTVQTVMEAMTERLVLVSTPESGEQVRFDIRQLQEFFAAEFLYDSVAPDILAHRVQLVGADAHWREVMHFLLSALVEHRRTTEVDVVVKVLEAFNEGHADDVNRLFFRRMAKGSLLALRLLSEGVLEQDKRDRLRLKPLFEPFGGLLEVNVLRGAVDVTATNSRQWLIGLLKEKLVEANHSESIGAAIALGWLMPADTHDSCELTQWFQSLPLGYQGVAFSAWAEDFRDEPFHVQKRPNFTLMSWALVSTVKVACSNAWRQLPAASKLDVRAILTGHRDDLEAVAIQAGLPKDHAQFLASLFNPELNIPLENRSISCGPVSISVPKYTWLTGSVPESLRTLELAPELQGLLGLAFAALRFARDRSFGSLVTLLDLLPEGEEEALNGLPPWMAALVPARTGHYGRPFDCQHLRILTEKEFPSFLSSVREEDWPAPLAGMHLLGRDVETFDSQGWTAMCTLLPAVGIHLCGADDARSFGISRQVQDKARPMIKEALLASPYLSFKYFLYLGDFLESSDVRRLKSLTLGNEAIASCTPVFGRPSFKPFTIPNKRTDLIFALAAGMASSIEYGHDRDWPDTRKVIAEAIAGYGLNIGRLQEMSLDSALSVPLRAGAHFLTLLCKDTRDIRTRLLESMSNSLDTLILFFSEGGCWYEDGFSHLMEKELSGELPSARRAATLLLERAREHVQTRPALAGLLRVWRERSASPITTSQTLARWLEH